MLYQKDIVPSIDGQMERTSIAYASVNRFFCAFIDHVSLKSTLIDPLKYVTSWYGLVDQAESEDLKNRKTKLTDSSIIKSYNLEYLVTNKAQHFLLFVSSVLF